MYNTLPVLIALRSVLAAPNLQTAVFCLEFNSSENYSNNFLRLAYLFILFFGIYCTIFSKPFRSDDYSCFQDGLILLLVVTFTSRFVHF